MDSHITTTIRPPTAQALGKALQILLESSNKQNSRLLRENNLSLIEVHNNRIKAYEALIESAHTGLEDELKKLVHQRNVLSPFHRLPLSVFTTIIKYYLVEDQSVNSARPALLKKLASVSSDWLKTVKSTPALWTLIDGSWNLQTVHLFLRKSQPAPLNVRYVDHWEGSEKLRPFLDAILPHRARWRSVMFKFNGPDVDCRLNIPAHILENIHVSSTDPPFLMTPPFSIILASSEPLPAIKVEEKSFTWTGQMRGLWTLRLGGLSHDAPTCNQVLESITQSPQLESIHFFHWDAPDKHPDTKGDAIHLSRLHTLRCRKIPSSIQYAIARRVVAPACRRVAFDLGPEGGIIKLDLLHHLSDGIGDRIKSLIKTRSTVEVIISDHAIRLSSPSGYTYPAAENGVDIGFRVAREEELQFLGWLSGQLPDQADITLKLDRKVSNEVLGHFPSATGLTSSQGSFKILAKPTCSNNQVTWPLPQLARLNLYSEILGVREFKEFVWDRWGMCEKAHTRMEARLGIMVRPRTLEVLTLPNDFAGKAPKAENHACDDCVCRDP